MVRVSESPADMIQPADVLTRRRACQSPPSHPPRQHFNVMLRAPIAASASTGPDAVVGIMETIASNAIDATRRGAAPSRLAYSPSACPPPCVRTTALIEVPTIVALGLHPHSTP
ncbi:hypothetical protein FIBSPDRAFT_859828 [Athelia psychrophila]|uniref:Uncharacterized protein n=1 Tax=Athelia psychrophila TaxID=1759441 RepID=A0A166KTX1_9AGAM|nr:hypothetical protein FIBSPDRAFT_859828 [Fibularhizoctonia sp. CBS 109695]